MNEKLLEKSWEPLYTGHRPIETMSALPPSFKLEDQLLAVVRNSIVQGQVLPRSPTLLTKEKTPVGSVIPDMVIATGHIENRNTTGGNTLSHFECIILSEILRLGATSVSELAQTVFAQDHQVSIAVNKLIKRNLIRHRRGGRELLGFKSKVPKIKIISIETKLTRWSEAIEQATAYRQFSNSSYVAMPRETILENDAIKEGCAETGIGLLAVDRKGVASMLRPQVVKNQSPKWIWLADKLLGFSRFYV